MTRIIAVAGKGGVGKTTVSSLIVQMLARSAQGTILAVDADPNSNLADKLGIIANGSIGAAYLFRATGDSSMLHFYTVEQNLLDL
ncbi:MAG: hypothetical protein EOM52_13065, partial [Clostridia bacterium]|nr:hypothetical protein [Clostridia bacterium]